MKNLYFIAFFYFLPFLAFSQHRYDIWYFGHHAGLSFNASPPAALNNSAMSQFEGSATICDNRTGELLFYTNGINIWNRNHQIMANGTGLLGNESSTQSALIVPDPSNDNKYYVFTAPTESMHPMSYSIVDMTLDGGSGDVTAVKNVPLLHPATEKLTATLKSNGIDYWVLAKEFGTNSIFAYSLTSAGIDPNPVISNSGYTPNDPWDAGFMKVSPDGAKLCIAYSDSDFSQLFDFDNTTGIASNPIDLRGQSVFQQHGSYGVEFSPNSTKLYVYSHGYSKLIQYDLSAGSPTGILNSATIIYESSSPMTAGGLQLGPDGRLYVIHFLLSWISVINQPNIPGISCGFNFRTITLISGTRCGTSFPNNISYPLCPAVSKDSTSAFICSNGSYQMPSGNMVNLPGVYQDTVRNSMQCDSIISTITLTEVSVTYHQVPVQICSNETFQLPSGAITNIPGLYYDTIRTSQNCDSIITVIDLRVNAVSASDFTDSISTGESYTLPWGEIVNSPGTFQNVLPNSFGCDSTVTITLFSKAELPDCLVMNNAFTPNGDGINDNWLLYRARCFSKMSVNVYNRYGSLVYQSRDYGNDWNGTHKFSPLPDGTYYYYLKVILSNGREVHTRGNVTIVR